MGKSKKNQNIYSFLTKIDFKLVIVSMFAFISLWGLLFASSLEEILIDLCNDIMGIIPSLAFLLVTAAAVVYAAGQLFDAQTRARAQQWAISCLIGAVIGAVILFVVPAFLGALIKMSAGGGSINTSMIDPADGLCSQIIRDSI